MTRSFLASILATGSLLAIGTPSAKAQGYGYRIYRGYGGGPAPYPIRYGGYTVYSRGYGGLYGGNPGGLLNGGPPGGVRGNTFGWYGGYGGYPYGGYPYGGFGYGSMNGPWGFGYPSPFRPW